MGVLDEKGEGEDRLLVRLNNNEMEVKDDISAYKDHHHPLGHLPTLLFHHIYWLGCLPSHLTIHPTFLSSKDLIKFPGRIYNKSLKIQSLFLGKLVV